MSDSSPLPPSSGPAKDNEKKHETNLITASLRKIILLVVASAFSLGIGLDSDVHRVVEYVHPTSVAQTERPCVIQNRDVYDDLREIEDVFEKAALKELSANDALKQIIEILQRRVTLSPEQIEKIKSVIEEIIKDASKEAIAKGLETILEISKGGAGSSSTPTPMPSVSPHPR